MRSMRAAATIAALMAAGCSVILSTAEPTQCSTNADCAANPSLRGRVCTGSFCVIPTANSPGTAPEAGAACVSNEICTKANGNKAWHCDGNGSPCVQWQTNECRFIGGGDAWMNDNALIIGAIQPFSNRQANGQYKAIPYAARVRDAMDLAIEEVALAQPGGIVVPGGPQRPLAVIHCDSGFEAGRADAVFKHLTEVVRAPVVILGADEDLVAVTPRARTSKTAIIGADVNGPLPSPPLAWRMLPPLAQQAPMAARRVSVLEAQRKAEPNPPAALKVAVLTLPNPGPIAFVDKLTEVLQFNGKSTTQNGSTAFHVERTEDPRLLNVDHVTHAKAIADFRPDVVVVAMGEDFTTFYASLIEKNWPADKPPPYYVVTELNYDLSTFESVLTADSDGEDLRRRISGTRSGSSPPRDANIDDFERRYSTRYGTDASGAWSGYEAMYALIYAIQAASLGGTLDGPHISAGFERLRAGATIDVGPARIGAAFSFLAQPTETINLRGLWSELDWNPVTRDLETDVSMYCFQRQDRKLVIKADAGTRLSGGVFTGTYACD